jgi:outer membrane immunogenic protein
MKETVAPAPPACDFTWSGFYIGIKGGYGWSGNSDVDFRGTPTALFTDLRPTTLSPDPDGFIGGGEIGYNWQFGKFVIGIAADFLGSGMDGEETTSPIFTTAGTPFFNPNSFLQANQSVDWFGTVRARFGFAPVCRLLIYGTGGFAYANERFDGIAFFGPPTAGFFDYPASRDETDTGWTAGGGLEFAIARHWTIKAEYLYVDVGDDSTIGNPVPPNPPFQVHYNFENQFHTVTAGLNFKF